MNPAPNTSAPRFWMKRLLLPVCIVLALGLLVYGVTGFFRLSREARCLRNGLASATHAPSVAFKKKIELSVGAISFQMLRAGLSLVPLKPEVRTALRAVRGAEVGVYELTARDSELDHGVALAAADRAMAARGWDRLVGVVKERELVAVYLPQARSAGVKLQACIAVIHQQHLIVVSARSDLEPLMQLAMSRPEWKQHSWGSLPL